VNAEAWIVLVVGAATVIAQVYGARHLRDTAEKQADAAEKQAVAAQRQATAAELQTEAAQAALDRQLSAVLVVTRGSYGTSAGHIVVHNGGLHSASDVHVTGLESDTELPFETTWEPVIRAGESTAFELRLGTVERREMFRQAPAVLVTWTDGRGRHLDERFTIFDEG
jgi:hypothetical protein